MIASLSVSWSKRLAQLSIALLALALLWLTVGMLWLVLSGPQVETLPMPPVPQVQPAASARDGFRWDLFGEPAASVPIVAAPIQTASGALKLKGVMGGGSEALAIIADEQGRERVYRRGDSLPDGSTVEEIEARRVIVARDGRREALEMPRAASSGAAAPAARLAASPANLPGIRGFELPSGISAASLRQPGSTATSIADQVTVLPVAGGGFRVRPGRDATLFAELGLQVNDVVTAVNGQPLTTEEDARALFADVMRSGELSITINRQGREITLRPDLADLMSRL